MTAADFRGLPLPLSSIFTSRIKAIFPVLFAAVFCHVTCLSIPELQQRCPISYW
ncbi:hypothetical cytosolic protein [Syntrophus aciditrophicus SB]|uniref:Hypothetical cytosolic protein n=1 Tax=Syntrophus aciditrophicus (strain SB) TaxID=56780 RepID=Q2LVW4_SYNAS|nr:hypothetical cytosolic protein [Syntrophus aciditrophicus SB]